MEYSGAGGKMIHKKNQKQKISWHCPFNQHHFLVWRNYVDSVAYNLADGMAWVSNRSGQPKCVIAQSYMRSVAN